MEHFPWKTKLIFDAFVQLEDFVIKENCADFSAQPTISLQGGTHVCEKAKDKLISLNGENFYVR